MGGSHLSRIPDSQGLSDEHWLLLGCERMTDWKFIFEKWILGQHRPQYESEVMRALKKISGDLFVDIGANVGIYSKALSKNFRKVYAFEPNPSHGLDDLPRNVTVFRCALGNEDAERDFYIFKGDGSADTLLRVFDYKPASATGTSPQTFVGKRSFPVKVSKYDSEIKERADLVKIDVEGAEFLVLEGMEDSLRKGLIQNLMVELHNIDNEKMMLGILAQNFHSVQRLDEHPRFLASVPSSPPVTRR